MIYNVYYSDTGKDYNVSNLWLHYIGHITLVLSSLLNPVRKSRDF